MSENQPQKISENRNISNKINNWDANSARTNPSIANKPTPQSKWNVATSGFRNQTTINKTQQPPNTRAPFGKVAPKGPDSKMTSWQRKPEPEPEEPEELYDEVEIEDTPDNFPATSAPSIPQSQAQDDVYDVPLDDNPGILYSFAVGVPNVHVIMFTQIN